MSLLKKIFVVLLSIIFYTIGVLLAFGLLSAVIYYIYILLMGAINSAVFALFLTILTLCYLVFYKFYIPNERYIHAKINPILLATFILTFVLLPALQIKLFFEDKSNFHIQTYYIEGIKNRLKEESKNSIYTKETYLLIKNILIDENLIHLNDGELLNYNFKSIDSLNISSKPMYIFYSNYLFKDYTYNLFKNSQLYEIPKYGYSFQESLDHFNEAYEEYQLKINNPEEEINVLDFYLSNLLFFRFNEISPNSNITKFLSTFHMFISFIFIYWNYYIRLDNKLNEYYC
jgi:hypothetical protein